VNPPHREEDDDGFFRYDCGGGDADEEVNDMPPLTEEERLRCDILDAAAYLDAQIAATMPSPEFRKSKALATEEASLGLAELRHSQTAQFNFTLRTTPALARSAGSSNSIFGRAQQQRGMDDPAAAAVGIRLVFGRPDIEPISSVAPTDESTGTGPDE
jgi:hypothetical protein